MVNPLDGVMRIMKTNFGPVMLDKKITLAIIDQVEDLVPSCCLMLGFGL